MSTMITMRTSTPTFVAFAIASAVLFILGGVITVMSPHAQIALAFAAVLVASVGIYAIVGSIARQKLLHERAKLRETVRSLHEIDADLRLALANAMRDPMTHIVGFSDRLLADETIDAEERRRLLEAIRSDSREVAQALAELSERPIAADAPNSMGVVLVDEEVRAVLASMPGGMSFVLDLSPVRAWADAVKVRQAIRTMIKQAREFSTRSIAIHTFSRTNRTVISLSADGHILAAQAAAALTGNTEADDENNPAFVAIRSARNAVESMGGTVGYAEAFGATHVVIELETASEERTRRATTVEQSRRPGSSLLIDEDGWSFASAASLRPERPTASIGLT